MVFMMSVVSGFVRSGPRPVPSVFVPVVSTRGRPREHFRVRIDSEKDADLANEGSVPLFGLSSEVVTALGYPTRFPTQLVVARSILSAVDTELHVIPFVSEEAARRPRVEDVAVALLSFDPMVGRVLLERNRADIRPHYLLKRVLTENVERLATWARFHDLAPDLPKIGESLPLANVLRETRKNRPAGAIP